MNRSLVNRKTHTSRMERMRRFCIDQFVLEDPRVA